MRAVHSGSRARRQARGLADAEIQRRLDELIGSLERAATLAPRIVSLHVDKKPINDVIAELAKKTGFKITTAAAGNHAARRFTFLVYHPQGE